MNWQNKIRVGAKDDCLENIRRLRNSIKWGSGDAASRSTDESGVIVDLSGATLAKNRRNDPGSLWELIS